MKAEFLHYVVQKALEGDVWTGRIRVHYSRRGDAKRYQVVKVTQKDGVSFYAVTLGHQLSRNDIRLDYDQRELLRVNEGDSVLLQIVPVGVWGKMRWYLGHGDPAVHVPAWLAAWSVVLGLAGIILGVASICK